MKNLIASLVKFQKEVPAIPKNKRNPYFDSYYAELSTVIDICSPVLNKHGLAIIQSFKVVEGKNHLVTMLCHDSGETLDSSIALPDILDAQKLTAAITYLRRSTYLALTGLVADSDDDGNSLAPAPQKPSYNKPTPSPVLQNQDMNRPVASPTKPASAAQLKLIKDIANKKGMDMPAIVSSSDASAWINNNK